MRAGLRDGDPALRFAAGPGAGVAAPRGAGPGAGTRLERVAREDRARKTLNHQKYRESEREKAAQRREKRQSCNAARKRRRLEHLAAESGAATLSSPAAAAGGGARTPGAAAAAQTPLPAGAARGPRSATDAGHNGGVSGPLSRARAPSTPSAPAPRCRAGCTRVISAVAARRASLATLRPGSARTPTTSAAGARSLSSHARLRPILTMKMSRML